MDRQKANNLTKRIVICLGGVFIGFVNGFFGAGGGMICVPILLLLGLKNRQAHATAVLTMLPISIASCVVYYSNGALSDLWLVLFVGIGSVLGGILGSRLLKNISNKALAFVFAAIVVAAGIRMLF